MEANRQPRALGLVGRRLLFAAPFLALILVVLPSVSSCRQVFHLNSTKDAGTLQDAADALADGTLDAVPPDGTTEAGRDAAPECRAVGAGCQESRDCCSGWCLADKGMPSICVPPNGCLPNGTTCRFAMQCCSMACVEGACVSGPACRTNNGPCDTSSDCCSNLCDQDKCRHPDGCRPAGDDCGNDGECCSHRCQDLGGDRRQCALLPGCRVQGELCMTDRNCCSGTCRRTIQGLSRCDVAPDQACKAMGEVCATDNECCSQRCRNLDDTTKRCQPTGGCRQTGERCDDRIWACCSGICLSSSDGMLRCSDDQCLHEGQTCQRDDQCCQDSPGSCRSVPGDIRRCRSLPDDQCIGDGLDCTSDDVCCEGFCAPTAASASLRCSGPRTVCIGPGGLCSGPQQCCDGLLCRRLFTETICTQ